MTGWEIGLVLAAGALVAVLGLVLGYRWGKDDGRSGLLDDLHAYRDALEAEKAAAERAAYEAELATLRGKTRVVVALTSADPDEWTGHVQRCGHFGEWYPIDGTYVTRKTKKAALKVAKGKCRAIDRMASSTVTVEC